MVIYLVREMLSLGQAGEFFHSPDALDPQNGYHQQHVKRAVLNLYHIYQIGRWVRKEHFLADTVWLSVRKIWGCLFPCTVMEDSVIIGKHPVPMETR